MDGDVLKEGSLVAGVVASVLPGDLDGKEAILQMHREGSNQWKQMEWVGWWLEHVALRALTESVGGVLGPRYGRTVFDYKRSFVWDLKAHPLVSSTGSPNRWIILNDSEATGRCIGEHGGVGYVIAEGCAVFDKRGGFKVWHDALKGGASDYEVERVARGAPSRRRKSGFQFTDLSVLFFERGSDLERGMSEGWASGFQKGMRNSNGSPRREKFSIRPDQVPLEYVVERRPLRGRTCL